MGRGIGDIQLEQCFGCGECGFGLCHVLTKSSEIKLHIGCGKNQLAVIGCLLKLGGD